MTSATCSLTTLAADIIRARQETDRLFEILRPDAIYQRPIRERHRLIFYLGHLEAFDWNQVCRAGLGLPSFHPDFDRLFEFGIDPEVGCEPSDLPADWPSVPEILDYNRRIRETFDRHAMDAPEELLHVALEHRLMHAETLAYLLHRVPFSDKRGPAPAVGSRQTPENPLLVIPPGVATLGLRSGSTFGWDNEFEEHRVDVAPFRISRFMITNGEYLEFVKQGGEPSAFWTQQHDGSWNQVCMFDEVPLPLDWPVWVTKDQAAAYAASRGLSLPTEKQFQRAAYGTTHGVERQYPWGDQEPDPSRGNFDFQSWDPAPVTAFPAGDSDFGIAQALGNGWEWTATPFAPFAGFHPIPSYPGYSANFFDGDHFVMKSGSPRTAARLLRRSFRNWFRPDYPHVYAGFRVVEN